ncbi:MAG: DUF3667 domain-containing protein [Weeksellaceae bacterium]|jgi:hypothetical protein|nr:DUF3667 domain-containing protein [Weeksellaceae bacterium]MDX9705824.1 DUF3667 domain-containing protein [Weeksellaceae bacterium]
MKNKNCLNCGKKLTDKFCSGCGQKSDIHRITFKNFFFHDILHGAFHIEKGILFTAKQALIRPGKAAIDYISGKRKPYYNVFLLILLTIGFMLFIRHFYSEIIIEQGRGYIKDTSNLNQASKTIDNIFAQKSKIVILLFVPFAALNSFILFKRKKLNLSEHSIIAGMILLGILLLSTLGNILFYFDLLIEFNNTVADTISISITTLIFLYIAYGYFNAFGDDYTKLGFSYRILLFFAFIFIEMMILLFITIGFITKWKFGEITISPFN